MNDIKKAIAEITDHAEHNLKVKLSAETAAIVVQALEKQISTRIYLENIKTQMFSYLCPNCIKAIDENQKYCDDCGQKLDWGVEDERD